MKKCTYCGLENPDEAAICSTCHTEFVTAPPPSPAPPLSREYVMSPEEQRFWKQPTFRQIIIVILRIVGLWLLFMAALQAITLAPVVSTLSRIDTFVPVPPQYGSMLWPIILRIVLHVAAGLVLILYTEKLLGWLVKDLISKPPPDAPSQQA
jgi:hypothetical protein